MVAGGGDFNGDGFDDIIVGASGTGSGAGAVHIVFGRASHRGVVDVGDGGGGGFSIFGKAANDYLGSGVAILGDANGDGFADMAIGVSGAAHGDDC